jgi:hypothetical protein
VQNARGELARGAKICDPRYTDAIFARGGGDDATRGDDSQETRDTHETTTGKERKRERERERIQNGLRKDDED